MSALDQMLGHAMYQLCAEMLIRMGLATQGRKDGIVAVAGDPGEITPFGEILSEMMPGVTVQYYGTNASFQNAGTFDEIPFAEIDMVVVAHRDPDVESAIAQLLQKQVPQGWKGRLFSFGSVRNAYLGTLQKLPSYRGCLNYRKLAGIAAAVALAPEGSLVECGVYHGGTTAFLAKCLESLGRSHPIFALDTFEGLPPPTANDVNLGAHYPAGYFNESSYERVTSYFGELGISSRIQVIKGLVQDGLSRVFEQKMPVAFALLDMDQYGGTIYACEQLRPVLASDGIILVDDVTLPGVNKALEEAVERLGYWRGPVTCNVDVLTIPR